MFVAFLLIFVVIAMALLKLLVMNEKKHSNDASREIIKICQDKEADNDKDNETLSYKFSISY